MLEKLMELFRLAYRQQVSVYKIIEVFKGIFSGKYPVRRLLSAFMTVFTLIGSVLFDTPVQPMGQSLSLEGYDLVFCDEFDGDSLDLEKWDYRGNGPRRYGYNAPSQVQVKDGNLILTGEYLTDGQYGEGWYTGMIHLREYYKRGYFEIKCICNKDKGFWSAFWLQHGNAYNHEKSAGGVYGAEIDIFEAMSAGSKLEKNRNAVTTTIHCNGGDEDVEHIDSRCLGEFYANNIYEEYNTYGLEWTEDEYIFYINGVESCRSSFSKGTSTVPEEVIVSLEIPDFLDFDHDYTTQMTVDYVKIYQKTGD